MNHPTDRITHSMAFGTSVVEHWLEREIAQWVHHEGTLYHGATSRSPPDGRGKEGNDVFNDTQYILCVVSNQ